MPVTLLLVPVQDAQAQLPKLATVYVNGTTGNDSYDGSSATYTSGSTGPKKTIEAGLNIVSISGTVNVAAGTYHEHGLHLQDTMNLVGAGAPNTIIDADGQGFALQVSSNPNQENTISGFTIQNGGPLGAISGGGIYITTLHIVTINDCAIINNIRGEGDDSFVGSGGGICNNGGVVYLNRCTISGNTATRMGGGIFSVKTAGGDSGLVEMTNCTISGNTVTDENGSGGGIYSDNDAVMRFVNVTIANNRATGAQSLGGGFSNGSTKSAYFTNCIVANNTAGDGIHNNGCDTFGGTGIHSLGYNIDSENSCYFTAATDQRNTNPLLGVLQNNGGPTSTHAIPATSPAYNRGTSSGAPATDQRGISRPREGLYDIGAFELIYSVNTAVGTGTATFTTSAGSLTSLTASATTACGTKSNLSFTYGFFSLTIATVTPGSAVTITITLPANMPSNTQYWKCINGSWVNVTSLIGDNDGDNVLTLTITDGSTGDADGLANGTITDPGGPAVPVVRSSVLEPQPPKPFADSSKMPEHFLQTPARILVTNVNNQPQRTTANQPVMVYANVVNRGDTAGSYTINLKIDDELVETMTGTINGHTAAPLQFTIYKDKPGTYSVDINGQKTGFAIVDDGGHKATATKDWMLIGFIICAIGIVVVSGVLIQRRRNAY